MVSHRKLSEIAKLWDSLHKTPAYADSGYPMIRVTDLRRGYLNSSTALRVTEDVFQEFTKRYRPQPGDIVLSRVGSYGISSFVRSDEPFCLGQNTVCISVVPKLADPYFVYSFLNSPQAFAQIESFVGGASQPTISLKSIGSIRVPAITVSQQKTIARTLRTYDDLIENNTRRIAILEEMARRIYEEWFVRFRFPGHENVRMVKSELGPVPEGWGHRPVAEVAIVHRGRSYKGSELADEGGRPFVNLKCINRDGGYRASGLKRYTGPFKDSQTVRPGALVMAVTDMTQERRIVARIGRVGRLDTDFGVISMDLVRIATRGALPESYLYAMFRWSGFADEVKQHANGANVLHLLPSRIEEHRFICPPEAVARGFASLIEPVLTLSDTLEQQNANLRATRDLLLPKLISGELDASLLRQPEAAVA